MASRPEVPDWFAGNAWRNGRPNAIGGAILASARLVSQAVLDTLELPDPHTSLELTTAQRAELAPEISRLFNVSRQLASIRLSESFPDPEPQGDLISAVIALVGCNIQSVGSRAP